MHRIGLLLLLALIGLAWWNAVGARTAARRAAQRACSDAGVGFIDELALRRLRLVLSRRNLICLRRVYGFEFFLAGDRRYAGQVDMRGRQVASLHMDPYPFPDAAGEPDRR